MMQCDFTNKRVLITGGTRGIGRAVVKAFLKAGARIAVNGRTTKSTASGIARFGDSNKIVPVPGDVATASRCEAARASILSMAKIPPLANRSLVAAYVCLGRNEEAKAAIATLLAKKPNLAISKVRTSNQERFTDQKNLERWLDALRVAGLPE